MIHPSEEVLETYLLGRLAGGTVLASAGEALRRGVDWVRIAQSLAALVTLGGVVAAVRLLSGGGGRGLVLSAIVQLTFAPFIAWRLALPRTARWFAAPRPHPGAPRVSGSFWVALLLAWSAAWGVLVAWSQSL